MPTQAAVQLAASRPQNQVYPLAVDEFTTNEQAAAPIPTIAPSIPLTVSGEYPLISIFDKGSRPWSIKEKHGQNNTLPWQKLLFQKHFKHPLKILTNFA